MEFLGLWTKSTKWQASNRIKINQDNYIYTRVIQAHEDNANQKRQVKTNKEKEAHIKVNDDKT